MPIGILVTKGEIDSRAGDIARAFQQSFRDVATLKTFLNVTTEPELVALGYTTTEAALLKDAINDLFQLKGVWEGTSNQATAKNFTTNVRFLWGVGVF